MKALFLATFLIASAPAVAQDDTITMRERCDTLAAVADSVMRARQRGRMSMEEVIEHFELGESPEGSNRIIEGIIIEAFDRPRMQVRENQDAEIMDFRNEIHVSCMRTVRANE